MKPAAPNEKNAKRNPRATRQRRHVAVPLERDARREVDAWRRQQHDKPRRKEAIKRLVILALENEEKLS